MPLKLYHFIASGPSRSVLMTIRALGLDVEIININLMAQEQLKPDFVQINPQHCVPTIDDDGFILWESSAINSYLVSKYGKDDNLYPNDLKKRALVNRMLYFRFGSLKSKVDDITGPIIREGVKTVPQEKKDNLNKQFELLEGFLEGSKWVAGTDSYTIADISILTVITNMTASGWNFSTFPRIQQWLVDCQSIPGYQENQEGAELFGDYIKNALNPGEI